MKIKTLVVLFLAEALLLLIFSPRIEGRLLSYEKADENDGHTTYCGSAEGFYFEGQTHFHMPDDVIDDIIHRPQEYTSYWVQIHLKNISPFTYFNLKAAISQNCRNLWFDESSLYEGLLNLKPGETHDGSVLVIIKTKNMSEESIDKLIKSLKVDISATLLSEDFFIRSSKTFSF